MSRYGIPGYEPVWLNGCADLSARHGARLSALAGRTLRRVWVVWDPADDEWFADAPVLLDFDGELLSVDHQKSDDVSLTWNVIDPRRAFGESWSELRWRAEPIPELTDLVGRVLRRVELLEWWYRGQPMSVAIGFDLAPAWLTVENAGDENGFAFTVPRDGWRRHPAGADL